MRRNRRRKRMRKPSESGLRVCKKDKNHSALLLVEYRFFFSLYLLPMSVGRRAKREDARIILFNFFFVLPVSSKTFSAFFSLFLHFADISSPMYFHLIFFFKQALPISPLVSVKQTFGSFLSSKVTALQTLKRGGQYFLHVDLGF